VVNLIAALVIGSAEYVSKTLAVGLSTEEPRFNFFSVDSLGGGKVDQNTTLDSAEKPEGFTLFQFGNRYEYRQTGTTKADWVVLCSPKTITLQAHYHADHSGTSFKIAFDQKKSFATLLGLMTPGEQFTELPAVLHLPDKGSFRIECNVPAMKLAYDATRDNVPEPYITIEFPPASVQHPMVEYTLSVAAIYPKLPGIEKNHLYDGFRRNYLNIFQVNPRKQMLANNSASDNCTFTVFEYAEMAKDAPPLVGKLTCNDLVRMTLDRYLEGYVGYGQPHYAMDTGPWTFLDVYPSLLISACDYAEGAADWKWAEKNFDKIDAWGKEMFAMDTDNDGLIEYPGTGNSGDRPRMNLRPSNWWDTIAFGNKDAYANALSYYAIRRFAALAKQLGKKDAAQFYGEKAAKLKAAYVPAFLDPDTGVLAGWRSKDGHLHDYWFTFVNGIAITYGLVDAKQGNEIMDRMLAKFKEVGYDRFDLGLPGNLVPVHMSDYVKHSDTYQDWNRTVGEPQKEDGTDAFQLYENGGATACWAYYTVKALYKLGRTKEARKIYYPMLKSFASGGFAGFDTNGQSFDWKDWQGRGHGYEGLLVDGYMTLLAVFDDVKAPGG
jgi:hypothetical protein